MIECDPLVKTGRVRFRGFLLYGKQESYSYIYKKKWLPFNDVWFYPSKLIYLFLWYKRRRRKIKIILSPFLFQNHSPIIRFLFTSILCGGNLIYSRENKILPYKLYKPLMCVRKLSRKLNVKKMVYWKMKKIASPLVIRIRDTRVDPIQSTPTTLPFKRVIKIVARGWEGVSTSTC